MGGSTSFHTEEDFTEDEDEDDDEDGYEMEHEPRFVSRQ